jgi:hypothetical protein
MLDARGVIKAVHAYKAGSIGIRTGTSNPGGDIMKFARNAV